MAKFVKQAGVYLYGTVKIVRAALPSMDAAKVWKKWQKWRLTQEPKNDNWQKWQLEKTEWGGGQTPSFKKNDRRWSAGSLVPERRKPGNAPPVEVLWSESSVNVVIWCWDMECCDSRSWLFVCENKRPSDRKKSRAEKKYRTLTHWQLGATLISLYWLIPAVAYKRVA